MLSPLDRLFPPLLYWSWWRVTAAETDRKEGLVMPIYGIATSGEKDALSEQLAFLYLEKSDISGLSPAEFAEKYFEVKQVIHDAVSSRDSL